MFEQSGQQRALVNLELRDGQKLLASVRLTMTGKLNDVLNNADRFLDILGADGDQYFLSKELILKAAIANPPKAELNLQRRTSDGRGFNAWVVMGIPNGSSPEEIKTAYRNLVKMYHPDRFANLDLPPEMKDYAAAMLARINIAHDQLLAGASPK
ncbi:MAG: J domain-containing protein [Hyphomicrobiales bacterium]